MPETFGYEEIRAFLRLQCRRVGGNARGFQVRANGRPERLSARSWEELAHIEALLLRRVEDALRREIRSGPGALDPARRYARGVRIGMRGEAALLRGLRAELAADGLDDWRRAAPALETSLWEFFADRTHYLDNTLALALNEPMDHPPIVWLPGPARFAQR